MSDFEDRLRDALRSADAADAADAPDATGLAEAARGRARTRRRTTLAAVAVAVALAVVAVPVGLGVLGGADTGRDPAGPASSASETPTEDGTATPAAPDGMRTESWRGLEVRVPDDWGYGALSTWCIGHAEPGAEVVERPGAVALIACTPSAGYGVQFFDPAAYDPAYAPGELREIRDEPGPMPFPVGAWVGYWTGDDAAVLVVARTEAVARAVLDSARTVEGTDGNGCAVRLDDPGESEGDAVSVCRYGAEGWLEQSERLSAEDGRAALAAIGAAPLRGGQEACPGPGPGELVTIGTGADLGTARIVWDSECAGDRGVFLSGAVRELTEDVMYWALSPGWSGGTSGSVPLPDSLR